jgi:chromosome segregation ATPase
MPIKLEIDLRILDGPADERKLDAILAALTELVTAFSQSRSEIMALKDQISALVDANTKEAAAINDMLAQHAAEMQQLADLQTQLQAALDAINVDNPDVANVLQAIADQTAKIQAQLPAPTPPPPTP